MMIVIIITVIAIMLMIDDDNSEYHENKFNNINGDNEWNNIDYYTFT